MKEEQNTRDNRNDNRRPRRQPRVNKIYEEKIISIGRVTKVTKGGRNFKFTATVVIGNRKGLVGLGTGKGKEVPEAIQKATQMANKNLVKIDVVGGYTISHEAVGVYGSSKVLLKPASKGTGIKAGGAVRSVLELAGITDILSKSLGSKTKLNVANATLKALTDQRTVEHIAKLRGKNVEEIR